MTGLCLFCPLVHNRRIRLYGGLLLRQRREVARAQKPRQRPDGGAARQRVGRGERRNGRRNKAFVPAVADRDQHIAQEAGVAHALDRAAREHGAKPGVVERGEVGQRGAVQLGARGQFRLMSRCREFVPGTDGEAIVAAIDPIADRGAEFSWDRAFALNGQIGDAAARIQLIGRGKGAGRADVETGAAGAAMVFLGRVGRKLKSR